MLDQGEKCEPRKKCEGLRRTATKSAKKCDCVLRWGNQKLPLRGHLGWESENSVLMMIGDMANRVWHGGNGALTQRCTRDTPNRVMHSAYQRRARYDSRLNRESQVFGAETRYRKARRAVLDGKRRVKPHTHMQTLPMNQHPNPTQRKKKRKQILYLCLSHPRTNLFTQTHTSHAHSPPKPLSPSTHHLNSPKDSLNAPEKHRN